MEGPIGFACVRVPGCCTLPHPPTSLKWPHLSLSVSPSSLMPTQIAPMALPSSMLPRRAASGPLLLLLLESLPLRISVWRMGAAYIRPVPSGAVSHSHAWLPPLQCSQAGVSEPGRLLRGKALLPDQVPARLQEAEICLLFCLSLWGLAGAPAVQRLVVSMPGQAVLPGLDPAAVTQQLGPSMPDWPWH